MAEERRRSERESKGSMTVQEAGRRGGQRTAKTHGREFLRGLSGQGCQRVKELIEEGKKARGMGPEK
jgi:hypothetical protein